MNEKTVVMLAKFTGVSVHTIKYYEKIGLLSSARREHSNLWIMRQKVNRYLR